MPVTGSVHADDPVKSRKVRMSKILIHKPDFPSGNWTTTHLRSGFCSSTTLPKIISVWRRLVKGLTTFCVESMRCESDRLCDHLRLPVWISPDPLPPGVLIRQICVIELDSLVVHPPCVDVEAYAFSAKASHKRKQMGIARLIW